jgi:hypothetical protein
MNIGWEDALEAFYGTQISDKQVPVWEHYLVAEKTNSAELVQVIEMAASENIKPQEWRVTVRDLRSWLSLYRQRQKKTADIKDWEKRKNKFVEYWKEKLSRGADKNDFLQEVSNFATSAREYNELCNQILG